MFDLSRTKYFFTKEVPAVPGATTISNEGAVLKATRVDGKECAQLTEGTGTTEAIIGFSVNNNLVPGQEVVTETVEVPAGLVASLKQASLVSGSVLAYNVTDSSALTVVAGTPANTGEVKVDLVHGTATFYAGMDEKVVQFRYRYSLNNLEQEMKFGGRPVNMKSNSARDTITYIRGFGELYTDQYDTTKDYSTATALYADANGLITTTSSGKTLIPGARVVSVPTAADPFLGIAFNLA